MKFDFKVKIRNQIFAYANSVRKKREKGKKREKKRVLQRQAQTAAFPSDDTRCLTHGPGCQGSGEARKGVPPTGGDP